MLRFYYYTNINCGTWLVIIRISMNLNFMIMVSILWTILLVWRFSEYIPLCYFHRSINISAKISATLIVHIYSIAILHPVLFLTYKMFSITILRKDGIPTISVKKVDINLKYLIYYINSIGHVLVCKISGKYFRDL